MANAESTTDTPYLTAQSGSHSAAYAQAAPYAAYLYIWGAAWVSLAALQFYEQFGKAPVSPFLVIVLALFATESVQYIRRKRNALRPPAAGDSRLNGLMLFGTCALVAILYLAARTGVLQPLDWHIGQGVLLACFYGALSRKLGKPVLGLALWQLALTATVGWSYLGFAPVLITGFSGASLLALAVMIQLWKSNRRS
ncbi:hypothetical protein [Paenibacillus sp. YYML68]|uniref:hypothetical protein n=1 Tax=Paenibacillus sp. YYML68 TaxID=2909250 RepID=UPI0024937DB1|nr:hypothetical protein [Paenibacillus sp. YYML68]